MRYIILILTALALTACTTNTATEVEKVLDTLFIDQIPNDFQNSVTMIFAKRGEFTIYDAVGGSFVYSRYKESDAWLGEGYDTVTITVPDSVITFCYDYRNGDMDINKNSITDNGVYLYSSNRGWVYQESAQW